MTNTVLLLLLSVYPCQHWRPGHAHAQVACAFWVQGGRDVDEAGCIRCGARGERWGGGACAQIVVIVVEAVLCMEVARVCRKDNH